jgi:hypothetical protein
MMACPWDENTFLNSVQQILNQVFSILTVILGNSMINSTFYLLSTGWCTTVFEIDRNRITSVVVVFGSIYVSLLAQSYSRNDNDFLSLLINLVLCGIYISLLRICRLKLIEQIGSLNQHLAPEHVNDFPVFV